MLFKYLRSFVYHYFIYIYIIIHIITSSSVLSFTFLAAEQYLRLVYYLRLMTGYYYLRVRKITTYFITSFVRSKVIIE